jgi:hypothetical protein
MIDARSDRGCTPVRPDGRSSDRRKGVGVQSPPQQELVFQRTQLPKLIQPFEIPPTLHDDFCNRESQ